MLDMTSSALPHTYCTLDMSGGRGQRRSGREEGEGQGRGSEVRERGRVKGVKWEGAGERE